MRVVVPLVVVACIQRLIDAQRARHELRDDGLLKRRHEVRWRGRYGHCRAIHRSQVAPMKLRSGARRREKT